MLFDPEVSFCSIESSTDLNGDNPTRWADTCVSTERTEVSLSDLIPVPLLFPFCKLFWKKKNHKRPKKLQKCKISLCSLIFYFGNYSKYAAVRRLVPLQTTNHEGRCTPLTPNGPVSGLRVSETIIILCSFAKDSLLFLIAFGVSSPVLRLIWLGEVYWHYYYKVGRTTCNFHYNCL